MGDISKDINSKFPNNKIKAFINIKYTANWINSQENEFFKQYSISSQQFNILRILRGAKEAIKVQTIKDRMIERAPNATRLMDKLCEKNLIDRERCKHDRRVVYISITQQGKKLLKAIDDKLHLDFIENLTEEEATQLSDLLDKIRQ
ncbi:MarR family winged helix-turn-helix transcriptional regulator [Tenacibaculum singaporense]|uniref:MarR family winged helix-turn-helix transcriptional regulator n=1 Tax=Tenacibaculum singaporense TaxID=2358479 RepID=UPI000F684A4A|nr:MarR family transcriptional regulator [Tenacibaculum singaporense]RSC93743.1 MarR family transcriptional regulator [Tenacibaculum singaporense]